jgi:hypothetical protein
MPAVNLLARGYRLEVSADGATNWLKLGGLNDLSDQISPNKVDSSNYDSDGWAASEITLQSWSVAAKYNRQATAGVTDAAAELLRQARGQFGDAARVYVRWYSTVQTSEPGWQGRAIVEVNKSKTGVADLNEFTATLTGDGALSSIANPYVPASVPSILSASPSGVAAGGQVEIRGTGFTGTVSTTGVKFGATNATSWIVVSDQEIVAVMPAGTAGAANIVVTNATGASTAFTYTRGA